LDADKKILIVDDDLRASSEIKEFLEIKGYKVFHVSDGSKVLENVKKVMPDLVVLDIIMPGVDGFTIAKQILYDEQVKNIPIIISSSQEGMKELFAIEGMKDYLVKPVDKEQLLETIQKKLGQ